MHDYAGLKEIKDAVVRRRINEDKSMPAQAGIYISKSYWGAENLTGATEDGTLSPGKP